MSEAPIEHEQSKQKSILIIDDDADIREVLRYQLAGLGPHIQIYEAAEGKEGLDIIHRINPDVVLSDYEMPGLSGLELSKILRDEGIKTPVIWVTGRGSKELFQEAWKAGVYDFFEKPINFGILKECVLGAFAWGLDYNQKRKSNFLNRHSFQELNLTIEKEVFLKLSDYCLTKNISISTFLNQLIKEKIETK